MTTPSFTINFDNVHTKRITSDLMEQILMSDSQDQKWYPISEKLSQLQAVKHLLLLCLKDNFRIVLGNRTVIENYIVDNTFVKIISNSETSCHILILCPRLHVEPQHKTEIPDAFLFTYNGKNNKELYEELEMIKKDLKSITPEVVDKIYQFNIPKGIKGMIYTGIAAIVCAAASYTFIKKQ